MDSILDSIKQLLGVTEEHFDPDIIMNINTVFLTLNQLGVGPEGGFYIEDENAIWDDYINATDDPDKAILVSAVKSFIHLKVKLLFDPPLSASVTEVINRSIAELEWRINHEVESK